jgi:hypothetical protein
LTRFLTLACVRSHCTRAISTWHGPSNGSVSRWDRVQFCFPRTI